MTYKYNRQASEEENIERVNNYLENDTTAHVSTGFVLNRPCDVIKLRTLSVYGEWTRRNLASAIGPDVQVECFSLLGTNARMAQFLRATKRDHIRHIQTAEIESTLTPRCVT